MSMQPEGEKQLLPKACQETIDRLTDLDEGVLRLGDALRVQLHLLQCRHCRAVQDDLRKIPELAKAYCLPELEPLMPLAQNALKAALARLPEAKRRAEQREPLPSPVPAEIQEMLSKGADLTLKIMAMVHDAFVDGSLPLQAPFLPAAAMAHLPVQERWGWEDFDGAKVVTLLGAEGGPRLSLLRAPRGFKRAEHEHLGTEQMLILDGLLEDGQKAYATGQWVHFGRGSIHEPVVLNGDCWCLIREDGPSRFTGPLGWLKNRKA